MNCSSSGRDRALVLSAVAVVAVAVGGSPLLGAGAAGTWTPLFDGHSLAHWRAAEHPETWSVQNGCLVAEGERSHLFYDGPVAEHDFRNFELRLEVWTEPNANSGVYFHTRYQAEGWPKQGYEVQINNSHRGSGAYRELKRTGSLYAVRNVYRSCAEDREWFTMRIRVVGNRIAVWVNDFLTVDYVQGDTCDRTAEHAGAVLSRGTVALQGHDPNSRVMFRRVAIRVLPDDADPDAWPRAPTAGYGLAPDMMERTAGRYLPVIDYHVHLRGGMTAEKALARQAVTGINVGVLRNLGKGWPLETDEQLRAFLDDVEGMPLFAGVQVNDRDWYTKHDPKLLQRLDYVLADTMIMPMPRDDSPPVKLWIADQYSIEDADAWMERYMQHNLRVLAEPITILANPTWLPPAVQDQYDRLWTEQRMRTLIQAAVENGVALEINARSGLPSDRFIRLAKEMGARFTFGSNNHDDSPTDMARCFEVIERFELAKNDMYVPATAVTRYARFRVGGTVAYGIVEGNRVWEIEGDLFGKWNRTSKSHRLDDVQLLVPTVPSKVLACAGNYQSHDSEAPQRAHPELFFKVPSCLIAQGETILLPNDTEDVHYEAELVIVIGKRAKDVSRGEALDYVLGVTCGNDISARIWQSNDTQWWRAKGSDTFGPCGPFVVSGIDYDNLMLELRLNGDVRQQETTANMEHGVASIVSFASRYVTLEPGDLIFTGTPGTTDKLSAGDVVEVELSGVGVLKNAVKMAD